MKISIIHGSNLSLLTDFSVQYYKKESLNQINQHIEEFSIANSVEVDLFQSNDEGNIVNHIHQKKHWADAFIINPGSFKTTSISILNALQIIRIPYVEVSLYSDSFCNLNHNNRSSIFTQHALASISGFGGYGYILAMQGVIQYLKEIQG